LAKKILWSFNPFQEDPRVLRKVSAFLKILARQSKSPVQPVYVVSPAEVRVDLEFSVPAQDRYRAVALLECARALRKISFPGLQAPEVLVENNLRLSASARSLAKYAQKIGAEAIVVGTQGKHGLGRLLLGSFAETLLLHSATPVITVNPLLKKTRPLKRALFASDFSAASRRAFAVFCAFLKKLKAKVTLFHSIPLPFPWAYPATEYLLGLQPLSEGEYLRKVQKENTQKAQAFLKIARRAKVPCELRLETSSHDVGSATLGYAKAKKIDAIALAAQTGRWETTLLGSTSREILREATMPVWVLR